MVSFNNIYYSSIFGNKTKNNTLKNVELVESLKEKNVESLKKRYEER